MERYDLIVIGSGPAGEKGAAQAAYFKKRVALIERSPHLGGAGINTGTIPSKTLREAALYFSGLQQRGLYGIDYSLKEGCLSETSCIVKKLSLKMSKEDCKAKNIPYLVGRAYYEKNARGQVIGDMSGMVKLVFSPQDKRVLGVQIIGEQASELIHIGSHVLMTNGTIDAFIQAVYNYPTLSELYKYAAYDGLGNLESATGISPQS